jgi:hypothetical protein
METLWLPGILALDIHSDEVINWIIVGFNANIAAIFYFSTVTLEQGNKSNFNKIRYGKNFQQSETRSSNR